MNIWANAGAVVCQKEILEPSKEDLTRAKGKHQLQKNQQFQQPYQTNVKHEETLCYWVLFVLSF